MGANGSVEAGGVDSDMLELIFMKAAKPRELAPGERLVVEGEVMKSVFLLTEGELCLKKKGENGVSKPTGISRYKGALLGELSLLLGYPASVSIEVSPKYSGASVLELPQEQLLSMLSSDPHLAGGFFRLLGATLGERITEASADLRKATFTAPHVQASSAVTTVLPGSLDRSVAEVAGEFEMPLNAEMLLHCDAVMTIEENSVTETEPHNAKMYARPAHLTTRYKTLTMLSSHPTRTHAHSQVPLRYRHLF